MKIRDKNLVIVTVKMTDIEDFLYRIISYDTLKKILNKTIEFWEDSYKNFYATSLTSVVSIKFDYLNNVEKLIRLEDNNKEAELIVEKRKLIDKLEDKKSNLDSNWDSEAIKMLNEVIEELKEGQK